VPPQESDYTHYAFTVAEEDFEPFSHKLEQAGVTVWKQNKSEGASFYFLDPDGHKLELHVGNLAARLAACREKPYAGWCLPQTRLEARTFSLPASVTCVAASS
jgi:hypothetical protein